jgi:hypothetical protein
MPASLQQRLDTYLAGGEVDVRKLVYEPGLADVLSWIRSPDAKHCWRVAFVDRPVEPERSEPGQTRDQAMFDRLRALIVENPKSRFVAYLGAAHALKNVEVRDGVRARNGAEFTVPTVPAAELLSRWGIRCVSVLLLGVDPEGGTDRLSAELWAAGEREWGFLSLRGQPVATRDSLVRFGTWYETAERKPLGDLADAIVYFPKLTPDP